MKTSTTCCLLTSSFLLGVTAHAQTTFSVGPRVGLNVSTVHLPADHTAHYTSRAGVEAGLTGNIQFEHFALQPSILFSQKGYTSSGSLGINIPATFDEEVRLNYLTVPFNVAFALGKAGQGLQVLAGPYVSMLVGGHYVRQIHVGEYFGSPASETEFAGKIKPGGGNKYSQRFDTGLQAGVGYRLGGFQVQASYSLGLRNLAEQYLDASGYAYQEPSYYNRAWQVSLSYLVGKS